MESRPLLTINISTAFDPSASVGGLGDGGDGRLHGPGHPVCACGCSSAAPLAGALAAAIVIRRHREHVIGTPGDDLPMALGLHDVRSSAREVETPTRLERGSVPRLAVSY